MATPFSESISSPGNIHSGNFRQDLRSNSPSLPSSCSKGFSFGRSCRLMTRGKSSPLSLFRRAEAQSSGGVATPNLILGNLDCTKTQDQSVSGCIKGSYGFLTHAPSGSDTDTMKDSSCKDHHVLDLFFSHSLSVVTFRTPEMMKIIK
jgi:hypothetical protein